MVGMKDKLRNEPPASHRAGRSRWVSVALAGGMAMILALVAGIAVLVSMSGEGGSPTSGGAAQKQAAADPARLVGRWERPDGGYVLELRSISAEGKIEAAYLNPRPINVSRAELRTLEGQPGVFVELRDVNYPGSTYLLRYRPDQDVLAGTYHQAATGEDYEVYFVRLKDQ